MKQKKPIFGLIANGIGIGIGIGIWIQLTQFYKAILDNHPFPIYPCHIFDLDYAQTVVYLSM